MKILIVSSLFSLFLLIALPLVIIVPIMVAFLSGIVGLFIMLGSNEADRRLVLTGYNSTEIIFSRLLTFAIAH